MANDELHLLANNRLSISRKFAKEYQKQVKKWLDDYNIDSLDELRDADTNNLMQIPYIFATIESQLPSVFENTPELLFKKRGRKDKDFTDFANSVWHYLQDKLHIKEKIENAGFNFLALGQSSSRWGWRLETEEVEEEVEEPLFDGGEQIGTQPIIRKIEVPIVNEPYLKIHQHNRIYFSPESYFTVFDEENEIPYIITEELMTPDQVEEVYGVKVEESSYLDTADFNDEAKDMSDEEKGDLQRINVYEYFGVLPKDKAKDSKWRSSKVYQFAFCQSKMLEKPKPIQNKPIALLGNYGTFNKFFRFGEPKVMRELEQDISVGRSTIADYRDKIATKIAIESTTEVDEFNLRSPKKLAIVRYTGNNPPTYMKPPSIPDAVIEALNMSKADAQMVSAQMDISRGSTQSIVDTATGQKIFESANERRINRKRQKIGDFIKINGINLLKLCGENWDEEKFSQITDIPLEEIVEKQFIQKLATIDDLYNVEIDIADVVSNKAATSAQAIALYRETKNDPLVNRREVLRNALEIGFEERDYERYLNDVVTPEDSMRVINHLVEMQMIPPEIAQQMMMTIMAQEQQKNQGGRPATNDPVSVMQNSMPGADSNQIEAQTEAAPQQMGPKI
jgi:hypothetical protein